MEQDKKAIIFFSWQSDLDAKTNRNVIGDCIKDICKKNNLSYDEATKNRCGSPDIARSIEEKIRSADIFIADVTTINADNQTKPTPNPNVLFELGIAQALLGWERIILIVNTAYAPVEALPFDIDKHRAMSYSLSPLSAEKSSNREKTKQLYEPLKTGILSIIKTNPLKEILKGDHSKQIQYNKDYEKLENLLDYFFFDSIQEFCEDGPKHVSKYMDLFQRHLNQEVKKLSFIFYDKELETLIRNINDALNRSIPSRAPYRYNVSGDTLVWEIPFDVFQTEEDEKLFRSATSACKELEALINNLAHIVHERYPELNLDVKSGIHASDFFEEIFPKPPTHRP